VARTGSRSYKNSSLNLYKLIKTSAKGILDRYFTPGASLYDSMGGNDFINSNVTQFTVIWNS
jgi:hypothetical protein